MDGFPEQTPEWPSPPWWVWPLLFLLGCGLILSSLGLVWLFSLTQHQGATELSTTSPQATNQNWLYVEVTGAVSRPGVYRLAGASRVQDAIAQAGGVRSQASQAYLMESLNLASQLEDGQKIVIPFQTDTTTANEAVSTENEGVIEGKMLFNEAKADQLDEVTGIGAKTVEKIIAGLPYQSWDDLKTKTKITQNQVTALQERFRF